MTGLEFILSAKDENLSSTLKDVRQRVEQLTERIINSGGLMDSVVDGLNKKMASLGKDVDLNTFVGRAYALRTAIASNTEEVEVLKQKIAEYKKEQGEAFEVRDFGKFESLREKISDTFKVIDELTSQTNEFKEAYEEIEAISRSQLFFDVDDSSLETAKKGLEDISSAMEECEQKITDASLGEEEIKDAKDELSGLDELYNSLSRDIEDYTESVDEDTEAMGENSNAYSSVRAQMRAIREEMMALSMDGEQNTDRYRELTQELLKFSKAQWDTNVAMEAAATKTPALDLGVELAEAGTSAFETYTGVMNAFGVSTDSVEEAQRKLMSAIALGNGVTQIANQLRAKSNLMRKIEIVQIRAAAAARSLETKETWLAVTAQKALNLVANANPYVLLATAIASVVGVVIAWTAATRNNVKEQQALLDVEKSHNDYLDSIAERKESESEQEVKKAESELEITRAKGKEIEAQGELLKAQGASQEQIKANQDEQKANLEEQRKIEDEILDKKLEQNNWAIGSYGVTEESIKKERDELDKYQKMLDYLKNYHGRRVNSRMDIVIDGEVITGKTNDVISLLEDKIREVENSVGHGLNIINTHMSLVAQQQSTLSDRKAQDAKAQAQTYRPRGGGGGGKRNTESTELSILRKEEDNRIALIQDSYERENAKRTAQYDRAIADLQHRLKTEKGLTKKAKESLQRQIEQQEELRTQAELKAARDRARKLQKLAYEEADAEIDGMQDGLEKTLRKINLDFDKQLNELKNKFSDGDMKEDEYNKRYALLLNKRLRNTAKANEDNLSEYLTYEQKRLKIAEEYQRKIDSLYTTDADGNKVLRTGVTQENVDMVVKAMNKELADIDTKKLEDSSEYMAFFNQNLVMGVDAVRMMADELKRNLNKQLQNGTIEIDDYVSSINEINEKVREAERVEGDFATVVREGLDGLISKKRQLAEQRIFQADDNEKKAEKELNDALKSGDESRIKVAQWLLKSAKAQRKAADDERDAADKWAKTLEKMKSVAEIVGAVNEVMQTTYDGMKEVMESFGANTESSTSMYLDTAMNALDGASSAFASFASGDIIGGATKTISTIAGVISGLNKASDQRNQEEIASIGGDVDFLKKKYDELGVAIGKSYGASRRKLIQDQVNNIELQNKKIKEQIWLERTKKNTDQEAIRQMLEQQEANIKVMEELKEAQIDAIFGEDVQSAVERLADSLMDVWENGTDSAMAMSDYVDGMMKTMVKEIVNDAIMTSKIVERVREAVMNAMWSKRVEKNLNDATSRFKGSMMSINDTARGSAEEQADQIKSMLEDSMNEITDTYGFLLDMLDNANERTAASAGIAQASQDSVNELNGRATAIQGHTYTINENTKMLVSNTSSILDTLMGVDRTLTSMDGRLSSMQSTLQDFSINGIKMR